MGGDCLNYGCVPSKSLLAAAQAADTMRHAGRFGVNGHEPQIDFGRVHDHIHGVIAAIAPNDFGGAVRAGSASRSPRQRPLHRPPTRSRPAA